MLGNDEVNCAHFGCDGLFKCSKCPLKNCIHTSEVCGKIIGCCSGEDENLCTVQCPDSCKHLIYAISCFNTSDESISRMIISDKFVFEFKMVPMNEILYDLVYVNTNIFILRLKYSKLQDICVTAAGWWAGNTRFIFVRPGSSLVRARAGSFWQPGLLR